MRKRLTAGIVAIAAAATILAPAVSQAATHKHSAKAAAAHVASGTIESYDSSGKTLTVKGARDTWTFSVGDAKVWLGSKSMDAGDLSSHNGARVTVKYTEQGGQKNASSVRVAAAAHSKAKSKS